MKLWCKFGHVTLEHPRQRRPRAPPCGLDVTTGRGTRNLVPKSGSRGCGGVLITWPGAKASSRRSSARESVIPCDLCTCRDTSVYCRACPSISVSVYFRVHFFSIRPFTHRACPSIFVVHVNNCSVQRHAMNRRAKACSRARRSSPTPCALTKTRPFIVVVLIGRVRLFSW